MSEVRSHHRLREGVPVSGGQAPCAFGNLLRRADESRGQGRVGFLKVAKTSVSCRAKGEVYPRKFKPAYGEFLTRVRVLFPTPGVRGGLNRPGRRKECVVSGLFPPYDNGKEGRDIRGEQVNAPERMMGRCLPP